MDFHQLEEIKLDFGAQGDKRERATTHFAPRNRSLENLNKKTS